MKNGDNTFAAYRRNVDGCETVKVLYKYVTLN